MATTYVTNKNEKVLTSNEIKQYYTLKQTFSTYQYAKKVIEDMVAIEKKEDETMNITYFSREKEMLDTGRMHIDEINNIEKYVTSYRNARDLYELGRRHNSSRYLCESMEQLEKLKQGHGLLAAHYMKGIRCLYYGSRLMLQDMLNKGAKHYEDNKKEFEKIKRFHKRVKNMYTRLAR